MMKSSALYIIRIFIKFLKSIYFINLINEKYKANKQRKRYLEICKYYEKKPRASNVVHYPILPKRRLNILFLGTDYQQDSSGLLQSLSEMGKVTFFTKKDGSYGLSAASNLTSLSAYGINSTRLRQILSEMNSSNQLPDVIIGQMWGVSFDLSLIAEFSVTSNIVVMNIAMDDRHTYWGGTGLKRWLGSYGVVPYIDIALTAAPECVEWYLKEGCPAIFFPEASDPSLFCPMPELPKIYDVSFIGARYGAREKIVTALLKSGINVSAFGKGWEGGRLPTEDVPRIFAQSKIVLGIGTIGHCTDFYALKLRDFDAPMSGSFYLTNENPDLKNLYEIGREIETYADIADCVKKVKFYLIHDIERESIASAGRLRALRDHTWLRRFSDLFGSLNGG